MSDFLEKDLKEVGVKEFNKKFGGVLKTGKAWSKAAATLDKEVSAVVKSIKDDKKEVEKKSFGAELLAYADWLQEPITHRENIAKV